MIDASGCDSMSNNSIDDDDEMMNGSSDSDFDEEVLVSPSASTTFKLPKGQKQSNKNVEMQKKKIGPQRQKKEIHTYLKKAKKFEIRKLTRRISTLRNLRGSDQQKAKNCRKAEALVEEIQAIKDFLIDRLTERIVDIFKGTADQIYLDMWTAAQDRKTFENMLQTLGKADNEKKYEKIGFFRMISSKDIVSKLQLIHSGVNIKKPKSKKALRKQLRKFNKINKKNKKFDHPSPDQRRVSNNYMSKEGNETKSDNKNSKSGSHKSLITESIEKQPKEDLSSKKIKKSKKVPDPFFLPNLDTIITDFSDDGCSDEEFSAPVNADKAGREKKNRMGQRQRKKLIEGKQEKIFSNDQKGNRKQRVSSMLVRKRSRANQQDKSIKNKVIHDKELHPSWLAKQRLKAREGISSYAGTKIKFDD